MPTIKFSHNWNNKLNCRVFTTIRGYTEEKYRYYLSQVGYLFSVQLKGKQQKKSYLRTVEVFRYNELPSHLIAQDVGTSFRNEQGDIFRRFGITGDKQVIVLMFDD